MIPSVEDATPRLAGESDVPAISALMARASEALQRTFLTPEQLAASRHFMGIDTQLIADRTYFLVEIEGRLAGCGGWSRRATLFGGDASAVKRDVRMLDPATDAAKVRAMYTDPDFVRRGIGRMILALCERAAHDAGFSRVELMATLSGVPLYEACGYRPIERVDHTVSGHEPVPFLRMEKPLGH